MGLFKRIDILFLTYLLISTLFLGCAWTSISHPYPLVIIRILILPAIFLLIYWEDRSKSLLSRLLRWTYPLLLSGYFYSETVFYNQLIFSNLDPYLIIAEEFIFGMQTSIEFSKLIDHKVFSELMYFSYFFFYLLIFSFALYMFFQKRAYFKESIFKLSASLYLFYLLFSLFPSAGPQFYFHAPENILPEAYLFSHIMHFIQEVAEQPTGAFPSSHVGISIIILIMAQKKAPLFFKIAWPFVFLLILSTVYIKAHYAIDVIGGLLIAPIILYLSHILYQLPSPNANKDKIANKLHD